MVPPCEAVLCLVWPVVLRRRWTSLLLAIHKSNQNHTWTQIECDSWQYYFEKSITESTFLVKYFGIQTRLWENDSLQNVFQVTIFRLSAKPPFFLQWWKGLFVFYFQQLISAEYYVVEKERMAQSIYTIHSGLWGPFTSLPFGTLQGTNISPKHGILKMIFLFPRWNIWIPWRVFVPSILDQSCRNFHRQAGPDGISVGDCPFTHSVQMALG